MRSDSLVLRNSLWIGLQPLILNVISIFVTGFIARTLGQEDFGRFIFAFSFVALLMPVCNLGLRAITVRDIAEDVEKGPALIGRVFVLRMGLAMLTYGILVVTINLMGYPETTRLIVYLAGLTLVSQTAATTLFDDFQGHARMQYIAYSNLVSGSLLTAGSVLVLVAGLRLVGLTLIYVAGNFILFGAVFLFHRKQLPRFRLQVDLAFWRRSLKKGLPFFVVGMLSILNVRIGIVLLSKLSGDAAVGQYGASFSLIERLIIISESLCTAIFPTLSLLYARDQLAELNGVLEKFFRYLIVLGLPLAVGTTLLSGPIVNFIYGDKYADSAVVLSLLAWNLPFFFLASLLGYCLGAVHRQNDVVKVSVAAAVVNLGLNLVLIPGLGAPGVAVSYLAAGILSCVATYVLCHRYLGFHALPGMLVRAALAAGVLAIAVVAARPFHWALAAAVGALAYGAALIGLRIMVGDDWMVLREALTRKRATRIQEAVTQE